MTTYTDDRDVLLASIDLEAIWGELVGPRGRGGWPCPSKDHPQSGATPPVSIDREKQVWRCHGICARGGSAVDLLVLVTGCTVAGAFAELRRRAGRPESRPPAPSPRPARPPEPAGRPLPAEAGETVLSRFLAARGWCREVSERYGLHAVVDRWGRPRVRFDYRVAGELAWWQDRATDDRQPKWLGPAGRRPIPFAVDLAEVLDGARDRVLLLTEGPADAVALAHVGWADRTIGLPGTSAIPAQRVAAMVAAALGPDGVAVVATDADQAGDRLRDGLVKALVDAGVATALARPPDGLDLDDWRRQIGDDEHFRALFLAAIIDPAEVTP
ncbi:hypothetical protein BH24ACT3_BH24ACT3_11480 [soil metagenome]